MKKQILFITTAFPPTTGSGVQRVTRMLKWLPNVGYEAYVLTTAPKGEICLPQMAELGLEGAIARAPLHVLRNRFGRRLTQVANLDNGVKSLSGPRRGLSGVSRRASSIAKRCLVEWFEIPDHYCAWIMPALKVAENLAQHTKFHCVYSTSPWVSAHFVAARVAHKYELPLILEFRDIWVENPWNYPARSTIRVRIDRYLEKWLIRQADRIVTISPGSAELLTRRYGAEVAQKLTAIRHGFESTEYPTDAVPPPSVPLILTYAGTFYGGRRNASGLLEAIAKLINTGIVPPDGIEIHVVGDGQHLAQLAAVYGIKHVVMDFGNVSLSTSLRMQRSSHILLLVEAAENSEWVMSNLPGKLYEYLGACRPILGLANPQSLLAKTVSSTNSGVVFRPDDSNAIGEYLRKQYEALLLFGTVDYQADMQLIEHYSWSRIVIDVGKLLDGLYS